MKVFRTLAAIASAALALAALSACSPSLDWRETRASGADMVLTLPCKPEHLTRSISLAGASSAMTMTGCASGKTTFVLGHADVATPAQTDLALQQLRQAALDNLHGRVLSSRAAVVAQSTPGLAAAQELDIAGSAADGTALREHLLLFAQGHSVYQALVLAPAADFQDEAAQTFVGSIQLSPTLRHP